MNVYDFDKTIYRGDSTVDFYFYALKKKPLLLRYAPLQALGFLLYGLKRIDKTGLKEYFFRFLRGIDAEAFAESFWQQRLSGIHTWYLEAQAEDDVIISASPSFLLRPACRMLGIKHLIASEVDPATGKFLGPNCRGEEKPRRFRAKFGEASIDKFYSDSASDLPMARLAKQAYMVEDGRIREW